MVFPMAGYALPDGFRMRHPTVNDLYVCAGMTSQPRQELRYEKALR